MGRPIGSVVTMCGCREEAAVSMASRTPIFASAGAQLRSTTRSYWYQATATRPDEPAMIQGQLTVTPGWAITRGLDQVRPWFVERVSSTELAVGVAALLHPPDVPCLRSSLVHVM